MTVASSSNRNGPYAGDDVEVDFDFTFKIFAASDLRVYLRDALGVQTLQTLDVDYTVTGVGDEAGGTVTFITPPAATETVTILGVLPLTQATDYNEGGAFPAAAHETALDRLVKLCQQLQEQLNRAALLAESSQVSGLVMPEPVAGQLLGWNAGGDDLTSWPATFNAAIAVSGLYLSMVATDPAVLLGYGTWVLEAQGEITVGVGTVAVYVWQRTA